MNRSLLPSALGFIFCLSACVLPTTADAKPKKPAAAAPAGKQKKKAEPAKRGVASSPAEGLQPYISNLDRLLALDRAGKKQPLPSSGRLIILRAGYASRLETAQGAEAESLKAAIATCDALTSAIAERDTALADLRRNSAVKSSGALGAKTKSNFSQGTVGPERTRTTDVRAQAIRERRQNLDMKKNAARNDNALTAGAIKRWSDRSIQLRQQIAASYARISQA